MLQTICDQCGFKIDDIDLCWEHIYDGFVNDPMAENQTILYDMHHQYLLINNWKCFQYENISFHICSICDRINMNSSVKTGYIAGLLQSWNGVFFDTLNPQPER